VVWFALPSFMVFHTANAWEDEQGRVHLYGCHHDSITLSLARQAVGEGGAGLLLGHVLRHMLLYCMRLWNVLLCVTLTCAGAARWPRHSHAPCPSCGSAVQGGCSAVQGGCSAQMGSRWAGTHCCSALMPYMCRATNMAAATGTATPPPR
jgi:hypothetical protein